MPINVQDMLISVIVPVYNVEPYLATCLDSLLDQSLPPHEIILVDDGSTDRSGLICDEYSKTYESVIAIHKKNEGLGFARNTGLDAISGRYIVFVDSDDWLLPNALLDMATTMAQAEADLVIAGYQRASNDGSLHDVIEYKSQTFCGEDITDVLIPRLCGSSPSCTDCISMSAWSKMYRAELLKTIRFPSEREMISEDFVFNLYYCLKSSTICLSSSTGYIYRDAPHSLTTSYRAERFTATLNFHDQMERLLSKHGILQKCHQRLNKTFFISLRVCIKQTALHYRSDYLHACRLIQSICRNEGVLKRIESYPVRRLGIAQQLFLWLVKKDATGILFMSAIWGVF